MEIATGQLVNELQKVQLQNEQVIKLLDKVLQTSVIINNRIDFIYNIFEYLVIFLFTYAAGYLLWRMFVCK